MELMKRQEPSFWSGFASVLDAGSAFQRPASFRRNPYQRDWAALECDWRAVGVDLYSALDTASSSTKQKK